MGAGLECYTPQGLLTFTTEDRLARFLGSFTIPSIQDGSFNAPGLSAGGTPFFYFISNGEAEYGTGVPRITSSGDTISWFYQYTWPDGNVYVTQNQLRSTGTVFYGVM